MINIEEKLNGTIVEFAVLNKELMDLPRKMHYEYYEMTARHYDPAYAADTRFKYFPFHVDLARPLNGDTLEVTCGIGRILLPTARSGVRIDGLDFSPGLLSILRNKLKSETQELQNRVSLHQGDMRNFALNKIYDLITVPFRPLQHLFTVDDQLAAFRCFSAHLRPGGTLAFKFSTQTFNFSMRLVLRKRTLNGSIPKIPRSLFVSQWDLKSRWFLSQRTDFGLQGDDLYC